MQTNCLASKHNLFLDTNNRVALCCNSSQELDYNQNQVESALKGKTATEIQLALDSGITHKNCQRCWQEQQNETNSYRYSYNDMYPEFATINTTQLKTLHVQHDPTCNLTCVYCGPRFSSKWADLTNVATPFVKPLSFSDDALANLHMITLAGGEPGLSKTNLVLLERLLEVNPKCQVIINTNLFQIDNPIFKKIFQFENNTVIASFESTGDRYEYIRKGSSWKQFAKNFTEVSKTVKCLQASMILFPLSIVDLPVAIDFALEHISPAEIYINDYYGENYSWRKVRRSTLERLRKNLSNYVNKSDPTIQSQILPRLEQMVSTAEATQFPQLDIFDQLTNQNHKNIFNELYQ